MEALEETYRRAHTIGGSASMMDFPGLAHVAHGMEDILGDVLDDLAALDPPTIGLLQRSLARMRRLLGGIRSGINEDAVIAEDDADYSQYRVMMEAAAHSQDGKPAIDEQKALLDASAALSLEPAITSLDEILASFRTPSLAEGEEIPWPEEPYIDATQDTQPQQPVKPEVAAPAQPVQPSALEMLAATAAQPEAASTRPVQHENQPSPVQVYSELQEESQVLAEQTSSLKRTLTQLRLVVSIIEGQRIEFKSFLDGSKDALDRMEEWAGKAMGLNLRNSPEQVRRYLPLSVMWVANTKLKTVLGLLTQMTSSMEITEEQVQDTLQQLHSTIEACGDVFEQVQSNLSAHLFTHDPSWTPWEMQVAREAGTMRERVTFERRGDLATLRAEMEAKVREELRHEYENRPFTLAARAELERQIRNEILKEFEAKRQLQMSVAGSEQRETLPEIEARLRNEIEIDVRREFLSQLTGESEEMLASATQSLPDMFAAPLPGTPPAQAWPRGPVAPPQTTVAAVGELGEEATEIFRLEAEEHLQTISMYVADLENSPTDHDPIQGIRRATHTLKGAAAMMGFRAIADLCHISEDLLDSVMEGAITVLPTIVSLILDTAEALDLLINGERTNEENMAAVQVLRTRYVELLGEQTSPPIAVDEEIDVEIEENAAIIIEDAAVTSVVAGTQSGMQQAARGDLSVRVPLHKLDELVNLFGELLVNRSVLEERLQRLIRLVSDASVSSTRLPDIGS